MSMCKTSITCLLLLTLTAIPLASSTWAESFTAPGTTQGDEAFEEAMESASGALRSLRRSKFKPDVQADNLKAIQKLEMALLTAKANLESIKMSPNAKAKFGSDVAAYHAAFRTNLVNALMTSLEVEKAILANDAGAATEAFRKLGDIRNTSHELFEAPE